MNDSLNYDNSWTAMAAMEMMTKPNHITIRRLAASVQWKAALWEKDSIEPAMLRYPFKNQLLDIERLIENRNDIRCTEIVFEKKFVFNTYA